MKIDTKDMKVEIFWLTESWYSWPQPVHIPAGSYYQVGCGEYRYAEADRTVMVECAGDSVDIVFLNENLVHSYIVK